MAYDSVPHFTEPSESGSRPPAGRALAGRLGESLMLLVCLALTAYLAFSSALRKSVTVDEYGYLPNGLALLKWGAFAISPESAPLPKLLSALPVVLSGSADMGDHQAADFVSLWHCGRIFLSENAADFQQDFTLGRLPSMALLILTCLLTYGFARSLYGRRGGLLSVAFVCLSPNLIAHGRLITPDIYLAAAIVGSLWAYDALLRAPSYKTAAFLGLAVGLACLSKFTGLLLFALFPAMTIVLWGLKRIEWFAHREMVVIRRGTLVWGVTAMLLAMVVIHAGYGFQGLLRPLGEFTFTSSAFQNVQAALPGWLPAPLPEYLVRGMDGQLAEEGYEAYLLGRVNATGFWEYYLVGFLVKTPEPLMLTLLAAFLLYPRLSLREVPAVLVALFFFVFFSRMGHKNIGVRYLLFLIPIACVLIGRIGLSSLWDSRHAMTLRIGLGTVVAWMLMIAVTIWPDYLAYFNSASGGPSAGHIYLLDSNLDWGQDLIALRDYMSQEKIKAVNLAYFGRVPPHYYGIQYSNLPGRPEHRYVVLSANFLWGRTYFVNGTDYWMEDRNSCAAFRDLRPQAVLGHTLYVYDLLNLQRLD